MALLNPTSSTAALWNSVMASLKLKQRVRVVSALTQSRRAPRKHHWWMGLLLLLSSVAWSATTTPEYQLKAVFLFNFTQFVEWPPQTFADANSPLIIGVLGADPFGSYLDDTVRGETVNGRPLQVQRYASVDKVSGCHVLFISRAETASLPEIFSKLKGRSTLTVGENEGFINAGGMIRFLTVSNKIRLNIGLESAQQAGLVLSSKLLRPADVVRNGAQ